MTKRRAIVLLSGGLDSATVLAIAKADGYDVIALSFRYGQRHAVELRAARTIARAAGVARHLEVELDLRAMGGSALTADIPVPRNRSMDERSSEIPVTYVPARNTIFLAYALGFAEVEGAADLFLGVNALDYSGYPDCRPEYVAAFEHLANLATKAGVEGTAKFRIHTPLIDLSKREIIARGLALGVVYSLTHSCYDPSPNGEACGECDSCQLRLKGFRENGIEDPAPYVGTKAGTGSGEPGTTGGSR